MVDIIDEIEKCEGLTTLQLSGNSFGVEATKAIGECLALKPDFTRALLSDMFVSRLKSEIPLSLVHKYMPMCVNTAMVECYTIVCIENVDSTGRGHDEVKL